jgi:hypothetical protein
VTAFLAVIRSPLAWIAAAVIGTAVALGFTFHKGEESGEAVVATKILETTTKATEDARKDKEQADEKVRTAPPDVVIDSTR